LYSNVHQSKYYTFRLAYILYYTGYIKQSHVKHPPTARVIVQWFHLRIYFLCQVVEWMTGRWLNGCAEPSGGRITRTSNVSWINNTGWQSWLHFFSDCLPN